MLPAELFLPTHHQKGSGGYKKNDCSKVREIIIAVSPSTDEKHSGTTKYLIIFLVSLLENICMKNLIGFLSVILTTTFVVSAQDSITSTQKHTIYFEAGGNGLLYSLNYDHILKQKEKWFLSGRIGVEYIYAFNKQKGHTLGMPLEISVSKKLKKNFFEFGLGVSWGYQQYYPEGLYMDSTFISSDLYKEFILLSSFRIGYRHQKKEGGLFCKIGFTPLAGVVIDLTRDKAVRYKYKWMEKFASPWLGVAIGWTLKK